MPQFDFANVFVPQFVWLSLVFAVLYFGVVQTTLPRLGKVMTSREAKVRQDILDAEKAKADSDKMAADHAAAMDTAREQARLGITEAKSKAAKATETRLARAQADADAQIAAAQADIDAARDRALVEIEGVAANAAQTVVEKLTGLSTTSDEARRAARAALAA